MKTLREMVEIAIKTYDELNARILSVGASGIAVAGEKQLLQDKDLKEKYSDSTLIERTNRRHFSNVGEGVIPFEFEDFIAYINVLIKTNTPRRAISDYGENSPLNTRGICPVGMTVMRKNEKGLYEIAQLEFNIDDVKEIFNSLRNLSYDEIKRVVESDTVSWIRNAYYVYLNNYSNIDKDYFTRKFDEENWTVLSKDSRLGNILYYNKYMNINVSLLPKEGYLLGYPYAGKRHPINGEHTLLWKFVEENKATRRANSISKNKKGTVQYKISEFCQYLKPIEDVYEEIKKDCVFVDRISYDNNPVAVLRIFKSDYYDKTIKERYRVFIEKSKLTFAEEVSGVWTTSAKTISLEVANTKIVNLNFENVQGTKLEYLVDMVNELKDLVDFSGQELIEVLGTNLFELVFSDKKLKEIFVKKFINANPHSLHHSKLASVAIDIFGDSLNPLISTQKRIKNLPKKKWFVFSSSQMNKVYEFDKWLDENKHLISDFNNIIGYYSLKSNCKNGFSILGFILNHKEYRHNNGSYIEGFLEWDKYTTEKISSLSLEEFEKFLDLVKEYLLSMPNPFSSSNLKFIKNLKSVERKREFFRLINRQENILRLLLDCSRMVNSVNAMLPDSIKKLPQIKEGLETIQDVQNWHDDLIQVQNLMYAEKRKYYAMKEQEHYEAIQKHFDRQQKSWSKYIMNGFGYKIVIPQKASDLSLEGISLHHCVKSYVDTVAQGKTTILFIREEKNPDIPFFTMEVLNGEIRQVHGDRNSNVPEGSALHEFVKAFAKKHNLSYGEYADRALAPMR